MNSLNPNIIKRLEEKYKELDGSDQGGGGAYLNIDIDDIFNMSDVILTFLY